MATVLEKCQDILKEKNEKVLPENIIKGLSIFNVKGTFEGNVSEEITIEPSSTLQEITPSEDKTSISKATLNAITSDVDYNITSNNIKKGVSILGVNGALSEEDVPINIYMQKSEPEGKSGIWFNTNKSYTNIETLDSLPTEEFAWNTSKSNIPYDFQLGSVAAVGTNIYLFGGRDSLTSCYKYDTLIDTYTQLTNIPYDFWSGSAVSIGTDIYLFGSNNETKYCKYCYKYDTLTDTYAQMTNIPIDFTFGLAAAVGTDIYLFGSFSDFPSHCYKYNTLTDTYKKLADVSYDLQLYSGSAVSVGTDIYLFGGNYSLTSCYKYDTLTDTYTQMANIPYNFNYGETVSLGGNIYILGGNEKPQFFYEYNISANTYKQLTNIPYYFYNGSAVAVGTNIYLFGGTGNATGLQVGKFKNKVFTDKTIILLNGNKYETRLIPVSTSIVSGFGLVYRIDNVYYYTLSGGIDTTIDKYIGNGSAWIEI